MRLDDWLTLLRELEYQLPPRRLVPALMLTLRSLANEGMARVEEGQLRSLLDRQPIRPPVFVLGFPRSGTTHLLNLLSQDPRLAYPTALQTHNPHTFFFLEGRLKGPLPRLGAAVYAGLSRLYWAHRRTRAMDNVALGQHVPSDDDYAMLMLGQANNLGRMFAPLSDRYAPYLSLRRLDPVRLERWKASWTWFLRKLSLRYDNRPLVLKSTFHMARLRVLLELFPQARFVHVHRHPYELLPSYLKFIGLKRSAGKDRLVREQAVAHFLDLYEAVHEAYLEERAEPLEQGQLAEVRYQDLCEQPMATMENIYGRLKLGSFDPVRPPLASYLERLRDYQKNVFPTPPEEELQLVSRRLQRYLEDFGYQP